jgi:hypothetical protein
MKKKLASASSRSAAKTKAPPKDVDEYLSRVPQPARKTFNLLRATIRSAVPRDAVETISYRMPAIKHKKNVGLVCCVLQALQYLSHGFGDRCLPGRARGILHIQGDGPLSQ